MRTIGAWKALGDELGLQHIDQEWILSYVSSNIWPLACSRMEEGSSLLSRMHTSIYDLGRTAENVIDTFRYPFTVTVIPALLHTDSRPQFKDCYLASLNNGVTGTTSFSRDRLPVHKCAFDKILGADARTNEQMNNTTRWSTNIMLLPALHPGSLVAIQNHPR